MTHGGSWRQTLRVSSGPKIAIVCCPRTLPNVHSTLAGLLLADPRAAACRIAICAGDGSGTASGGLRAPLFRELLGEIHPASLNVFVAGVHHYAPPIENRPNADCIRRQGSLYVRNCKVNGIDAFMLRNEHPGPTIPGKRPPPIPAPHTMFEIVARSVIPGVGYGVEVVLEFEPGPEHLKKLLVRTTMPRDRMRRYARRGLV